MVTITKKIDLSFEEIYRLIRRLKKEDEEQLFDRLAKDIEMDKKHNLPKSFVRDIKVGLREYRQGKYSRDERG